MLAIPVILTAQMVVEFVSRTETSARDQAQREFAHFCATHRAGCDDYKGPQRLKSWDDSYYWYLWTRPDGDRIVAAVMYFPTRTEAWHYRADDVGKFELYEEPVRSK
jgi:hypothetical protein